MKYLSICSGIEAASVAWEGLAWQPVAFSEIEPFPSVVLAHRYPGVPNLGDMTKLHDLIETGICEAPDILVGGTPCQAFSVAGLRKSLDDARGNLSLVYCDLANVIDTTRKGAGLPPAIIVWENVPGVLSTKDNAFGCFLAGLAGEDEPLHPAGKKWSNAGYVLGPKRAVAWRVLDAQHFGLAQRRRRVFVVASARNDFDPAAVLFEFDGVRRDTAPRREAGKETAGGAGAGADERSGVVGSLSCNTGPNGHDAGNFACNQAVDAGHVLPVITMAHGQGGIEDGTGRGQPIVPIPFDTTQVTSAANYSSPKPGDPCHPLAAGAHAPAIAFSCKDHGADAGAISPTLRAISPTLRAMGHGATHANAGGQVAVAFQERGRADGRSLEIGGDVAYALTAPNGGGRAQERNVLTPAMQVRRLTPRECERLQGFPDDWTLIPWRGKPDSECPDGPRYKALGNSMAVPVMRWIGRRIDAYLRGELPSPEEAFL